MRISQIDTEENWSSNWPNAEGPLPNKNDIDNAWEKGEFAITIDKKKEYLQSYCFSSELRDLRSIAASPRTDYKRS